MGIPGVPGLLAAGLSGRFPFSMLPVALVIAGEAVTGSYGRAGVVSAGFSIAAAVMAPITGRLVDRFGQRRTGSVLLLIFTLAGAGLVAVLASGRALVLLLPLAVVAGGTLPNVGTYTRVRWTSVTDAAELETVQALESINDEASFLVGPAAATLIALANPTASVASGLALGVLGTAGVLVSRVREGRRPDGVDARSPDAAGASDPVLGRRRWIDVERGLVLLAMVGLGATLNSVLVATVATTEALGRAGFASVVFALNSGASFVAAIVVGRMVFRSSPRRRVTLGAAVYAATVVPFALVSGLIPLALTGAIAGLAIAPLFIQVNAYVAASSRPDQLTEAFSWIPAAVGVGLALGSALMGAGVEALGPDRARLGIIAVGALPLVFAALGEVSGLGRARRRDGGPR